MAENEATKQDTSTTSNNAGIENLKVLEKIESKSYNLQKIDIL